MDDIFKVLEKKKPAKKDHYIWQKYPSKMMDKLRLFPETKAEGMYQTCYKKC